MVGTCASNVSGKTTKEDNEGRGRGRSRLWLVDIERLLGVTEWRRAAEDYSE